MEQLKEHSGERQTKKKHFPLFVFLLILRCCVLFCSFCSLNQRCVAPFTLTMVKKKYTKTLSFGCSMLCVRI